MSADAEKGKALFNQALRLQPDERATFLDEACAGDSELRQRVEVLLNTQKAVPDPPARGTFRITDPVESSSEQPGHRIGHYKLLQPLGEGGMGTIWMAEQNEPVRRRVALKVIRLGMDTREVVARFEAERQALAMMDHPNIAKVLDAGATELGLPYFVMELVQGVPITHYCDLHNLSTLQRLELFTQVGHAIQHAHQKGIIHRDIKPSNILVAFQDGKPVPKVIDFGIAKAIGHQRLTEKTMFTTLGQIVGTPAYMSPEQAEMTGLDIDTRTDIYALGVLLYELLTGQTPFATKELVQAGLDEMRRIIREKEPMRPSTRISTMSAEEQTKVAQCRHDEVPKLIHRVRGDLDWITMKCLEKDRTRRYETANDLAADLRRHLTNEPVLARPPSNVYRLQKTVRRHKLAFAAAAAVLASLLLGLGTATTMFFKEQVALRKADAARAEVVQQKTEVDRKNAEYRVMLVEAARSDRLIAEEKLRAGQEPAAFAYLAHACDYDPPSTFAAEKAVAALNVWHRQLPTAILFGHNGSVVSAQFSPDGTRIVTTSWDNTARVWDAGTGKTLATLAGHTGRVSSAQFSPDGTRIVTASLDETARLWDAGTGKTLATLAGHEGRVRSAQFSPDGTRIVTASHDKTALLWDAATGKRLATLAEHQGEVWSAQFSPDGTRIVTASLDETARVWDAAIGKTLATLAGHAGRVSSAQFSPDGTRIVTTSDDKTARVWDAAIGKTLATLAGHAGRVSSAQFSPDSTRIVTTSDDKTARVWDAATGKTLATLAGHGGEVWNAQFSPDSTRIVTASYEETVRVWDAASGKLIAALSGHEKEVISAQFSPDGTRIVTASLDKTARVWGAASAKSISTLSGHEKEVISAQFSPDGTRILTASWDKTARVWDSATGKVLTTFAGHGGEVWSAQFSPDGTRILTASWDKTARVWDSATGKTLATLAGHTGRVSSAQFSPDGTRIVTASEDASARIWDAAAGKMLAALDGHEGWVNSAQFSPDGTRIVTASEDKTARVWDAATGKTLATLAGHEDLVSSAQFSPDGTRIVTASEDKTARVWDAATGKKLATLAGHEGWVFSAQFSPDGTRIVTASHDKTARIWDAATAKALATLAGHGGEVWNAQFSPDGTRIVTASEDKTARVWDVLQKNAGGPPEWFPDFLRYVAHVRLNAGGEVETLKTSEWLALREQLRGVLRASANADTPYLRILRKYVRE